LHRSNPEEGTKCDSFGAARSTESVVDIQGLVLHQEWEKQSHCHYLLRWKKDFPDGFVGYELIQQRKILTPMDFNFTAVAKTIEVSMAILATLIGVMFVVIDALRSLPSILFEDVDEPIPLGSFLIAPLMLTALFSFLGAVVSGGTERDIVMPILRSLAFALIPQIPGNLIRSGESRLIRFFFFCIVPCIGIGIEISLLNAVIRSCNGLCDPALVNNPIVDYLLKLPTLNDFL
jgi:hypothetical protein